MAHETAPPADHSHNLEHVSRSRPCPSWLYSRTVLPYGVLSTAGPQLYSCTSTTRYGHTRMQPAQQGYEIFGPGCTSAAVLLKTFAQAENRRVHTPPGTRCLSCSAAMARSRRRMADVGYGLKELSDLVVHQLRSRPWSAARVGQAVREHSAIRKGFDYDTVFCAAPALESNRLIQATISLFGWTRCTYDINQAY
eukprot:SAG25_NODE_364_length_9141_cov_5.390732_1_plen_194_part_10